MERALSYNWNVYKVFKNGSRAKAPITTFECDEITMEEHFNNVIKKNHVQFSKEWHKNIKKLTNYTINKGILNL